MKSTKKIIAIDKLHAFENHPYKVQDNEEMEALAESIKEHGIVSPVSAPTRSAVSNFPPSWSEVKSERHP